MGGACCGRARLLGVPLLEVPTFAFLGFWGAPAPTHPLAFLRGLWSSDPPDPAPPAPTGTGRRWGAVAIYRRSLISGTPIGAGGAGSAGVWEGGALPGRPGVLGAGAPPGVPITRKCFDHIIVPPLLSRTTSAAEGDPQCWRSCQSGRPHRVQVGQVLSFQGNEERRADRMGSELQRAQRSS